MTSLMTASPMLAAPPDWIPTGNLQIALPHISRLDAGVYSVGVTSLKDNALLELCGSEEREPALPAPAARAGWRPAGAGRACAGSGWRAGCRASTARRRDWRSAGRSSPRWMRKASSICWRYPASRTASYDLGVEGWWKSLDLVVFSARPLEARWQVWQDSWTGSLVGEAGRGLPLLAWGMQPDQEAELTLEGEHYRWGTLLRAAGRRRPPRRLSTSRSTWSGTGRAPAPCTCAGWAGSACWTRRAAGFVRIAIQSLTPS